MCEPVTIGLALGASAASAAAVGTAVYAGGALLTGNYLKNKLDAAQDAASAATNQQPGADATPPTPTLSTPPKPKAATPVQTSKTPAIQQLRAANTTTSKNGATQTATMLSGVGGVSLQPSDIMKNTLLGG